MLAELGKILKHRLALPLPGLEAQLRMAHVERRLSITHSKIPADALWGSVLLLLYEEDSIIRFPLIVRADYDGVHSGQVSFPGGKFEAGDENVANTALRETSEEIGIKRQDVELIGKLTDIYIPPSNFLVHPHVGILPYTPSFLPDAQEVVKIITPDLDSLMDESKITEKVIRLNNGMDIHAPVFIFEGHTVWGATAMLLSEFRAVLLETKY